MTKEKTFNEKLEEIALEEFEKGIRRKLKKWHSPWSRIKRFIRRNI